ncbi:Coronin-like protein crn1 [Sphaceloma murrayae]|uniref:Coronin n=1 Tax=Sphaceloma murrayae TaxID=2082308 RepID=A0A2K1QJC1_9PEZI|nr:Coronin-like protein crn1 [Sphaceloma murrayae]
MSGRFVRASKARIRTKHQEGTVPAVFIAAAHIEGRQEQCYDNLRITKNAWDTNLIKVNPKYIAVNWEASGGGAFAVVPVNERGKLPEHIPLFRGHTAAVLDTDWHPFDDQIVVSGSDDAKIAIYKVPDNFTLYTDSDEPEDVKPIERLSGHTRKVGHVLFNPAANNVLASSSGDYTIKVWDINTKSAALTLKHNDIVQSLSWSGDGSMLVTTCRDKKIRFWDVRQQKPAHEVPGHAGAKNSRAVWMGEHDRVATTGFSRMSDRQLGLWDTRNPKEPIGGFTVLDSISGVCMPFWDDGTQMLYLAGKGDGNIRYFEYENDKFEFLSEYKSVDPQRGIAFVPKRGVDLHENEVMRAYKTVNDAYIEPISFIVPRRAEVFQGDIYPPATGTKPALSSDDYFGGKPTSFPAKISLESIYEGQPAQEVPSETKPRSAAPVAAAAAAASPTKTSSAPAPTPSKQESIPSPSAREPPRSNPNESKQSMAALASKFADKDEPETTSSTSSFEEVQKPIERPSVTARQQEEPGVRTPSPTKTSSAAAPAPVSNGSRVFSGETLGGGPSATSAPASQLKEDVQASPSGGSKAAAEGIRGVLQDIKSMLAAQGQQVKEQGEKIEILAREVASLKGQLGK